MYVCKGSRRNQVKTEGTNNVNDGLSGCFESLSARRVARWLLSSEFGTKRTKTEMESKATVQSRSLLSIKLVRNSEIVGFLQINP